MQTAFEDRFQGILRHARSQRTWHVITAVPRSGKSYGINDFVRQSDAAKIASGATRLPVLAVRAPKERPSQYALGIALTAGFGVVPHMSWHRLSAWLVAECARAQVECIIVDDAHDLSRAQLLLLKELTDNLEAPPYERRVGLCLVAADGGKGILLRDVLKRRETVWQQFRLRLELGKAQPVVLGLSAAEVKEALAGFDALYRDQFPHLQLTRWYKALYDTLTNPTLDPLGHRRVAMGNLAQVVRSALMETYAAQADDVDGTLLQRKAELLALHHDETTGIDGLPQEADVIYIDGRPGAATDDTLEQGR
jgi:hypothetical protein